MTLQTIRSTAQVLARDSIVRLVLQVVGVALGALLVLMAIQWTWRFPAAWMVPAAALVVSSAAAVTLWQRHRGTPSLEHTALWIEEQARATDDGAVSFALVTWTELAATNAQAAAPLTDAADAIVRRADVGAKLALRRRRLLAGPLQFMVTATLLLVYAWRVPSSLDVNSAVSGDAAASGRNERIVPMGRWRVRVTPPAYTTQAPRALGDVESVRALVGSVVALDGEGGAPVVLGALPVIRASANEWSTTFTVDSTRALRLTRGTHTRLFVVEAVADSVPRVSLDAPARDSVLRSINVRLPLVAAAHDDIGLAAAHFEVLISSGEGERFTVTTKRLGAARWTASQAHHDATLRATLDFAALAVQPGDVIHVRAIARDAHPAATREVGASETRAFRIARAREYDSVAVEPAPPPAIDSSLLSQRMLLLMTERLDKRQARLAREQVLSESRRIARDQQRLRLAVGDVIFQRMSGESSAEHTHFAGDGHDHGVDLAGGKLSLSTNATTGMLEEGGDGPVIAINKPLLEAYNAMWDAGRALEQGDPHAAIPPMQRALAAIEAARAASRLYLRGRPPQVIVDIAKVRLTGKDTGRVVTRSAREAIVDGTSMLDARLVRAAQLAPRDAIAARDSLILLRLDALTQAPPFAAALDRTLAQLARGGDATGAFVEARRVLGVVTRTPATPWSRGGPP